MAWGNNQIFATGFTETLDVTAFLCLCSCVYINSPYRLFSTGFEEHHVYPSHMLQGQNILAHLDMMLLVDTGLPSSSWELNQRPISEALGAKEDISRKSVCSWGSAMTVV